MMGELIDTDERYSGVNRVGGSDQHLRDRQVARLQWGGSTLNAQRKQAAQLGFDNHETRDKAQSSTTSGGAAASGCLRNMRHGTIKHQTGGVPQHAGAGASSSARGSGWAASFCCSCGDTK